MSWALILFLSQWVFSWDSWWKSKGLAPGDVLHSIRELESYPVSAWFYLNGFNSVSGLCEQPSWKARSFINHRHPSSASVHKILFQWTFIYIVLMCWASFPTWSSSLIQSVSDSISMGSTVCQDRTAILESCNISYKSFVILFQLHQYTRFYSNGHSCSVDVCQGGCF